jgi:hypothetical protein
LDAEIFEFAVRPAEPRDYKTIYHAISCGYDGKTDKCQMLFVVMRRIAHVAGCAASGDKKHHGFG